MNQDELELLVHRQPHNAEAEEGLIASCLLEEDTSVYDSVTQIVQSGDFYLQRCQLLFETIGALALQGKPLNDVSVLEHLKTVKGVDEVGGVAGLLAITERASTPAQASYFAHIVAEKSKLRELMRSCRLAVEEVESETKGYDEIRSELENTLLARPLTSQSKLKIGESAKDLLNDIVKMQSGEYEPDVVKTHTNKLDDYLGNRGIAAGEVMTIAAPTSCGKSALALYIALQAVKKDGHHCGIFSLEMPQKQLTKRLTQVISGVNIRNVEDNVATDKQMARVTETINELSELPIYTSHSVKSADDLCSQTRQFVNKYGVKLLVIDYLQLIPFSPKMGKAEGIADVSYKISAELRSSADISLKIKQMAIDLKIAVILLAQVNREGAKNGRLKLYDLKDSGDIENDADIVLLMYPTDGDFESSKEVDDKGPYTKMYYEIAKNREGQRDIGGLLKFYHCLGRFA